jgi:superfamily II DNA/RNA helicase
VFCRMVKSATGSGKTLSYVLPIVQLLDSLPVKLRREDGTKGGLCFDAMLACNRPLCLTRTVVMRCAAVIMSPTRELCLQIQTVLTGVLRVCHHIVPVMNAL